MNERIRTELNMLLVTLLYPLAWVRVRLPKWRLPSFKSWNTAKFVADSRRRKKAFEKRYGDLDGFLSTLELVDDDGPSIMQYVGQAWADDWDNPEDEAADRRAHE